LCSCSSEIAHRHQQRRNAEDYESETSPKIRVVEGLRLADGLGPNAIAAEWDIGDEQKTNYGDNDAYDKQSPTHSYSRQVPK